MDVKYVSIIAPEISSSSEDGNAEGRASIDNTAGKVENCKTEKEKERTHVAEVFYMIRLNGEEEDEDELTVTESGIGNELPI